LKPIPAMSFPSIIKVFLINIAFFLSLSCFSQQGNNWYFGYYGGVTFNTYPPSAISGKLYTNEGCASISDNSGNLLFYTDGSTVYNKNHETMANGTDLLGEFSATQSALLIPQPGNDSIYYVFTCPSGEVGFYIGYNYSVVNMNKNGGLGEVVEKNIFLFKMATERLTAARHANGIDVWIIMHELTTNRYRAYLLDCNGVNKTPVISEPAGTPIIYGGGGMKVSSDGRLLAVASAASANNIPVRLYKFDSATGVISDQINVAVPYGAYSVEFSPDSKLLYATNYPLLDGFFQFDLSTLDSASIASSRIFYKSKGYIAGMQIGPDEKIYITAVDRKVLAAINKPNTYGTGCNYTDTAILLKAESRAGLPNYMANQIINTNALITFETNADCSSVQFYGNTSLKGAVSWLWDFGDGTTSTDQNPLHVFPGTKNQYLVKLTVTPLGGSCGKTTSSKIINLIRPILTASFESLVQCGNFTVQFRDTSSISTGAIESWQWDFGDGTKSSQQHPIHTYSSLGTYQVTLSVTYSNGCTITSSTSKLIAIEAKPVAGFSHGRLCSHSEVQFSDLSQIAAGTIKDWYWKFSDGCTSTLQNPKRTFTNAADYTVSLIVQSSTGCGSDTLTKTLKISSKPVANFGVTGICFPEYTVFSDSSIVTNSTITKWFWDLGNGNTSLQKNPTINYSQTGEYTVKLVVASEENCSSDTLSKRVSIEQRPIANFEIKDGCTGQNVEIKNNSKVDLSTVSRHNWDFSNNVTDINSDPKYSYQEAGTYAVSYFYVLKNGCVSDTLEKSVIIHSKPKVDFAFENSCLGKEVHFTNLSTNQFGNIEQWNWNLGNQQTVHSFESSYTFNKYGKYPVSLEAVTNNGCSSLITKTVNIAQVHISAGKDTMAAQGQPIQLHAIGAKGYTWTPSRGLNNSFIANPVATLNQEQTYYIKGVTEEGCVGYDTLHIIVFAHADIYVPNAFTPNNDRLNDYLQPICVGIKKMEYFTIYNRWGEVVFTTKEIGGKWNGLVKAVMQNTGSYIWVAKGVTYDGQVIQKKGTTTLIR
jgi:gliding motility-associated-like protein